MPPRLLCRDSDQAPRWFSDLYLCQGFIFTSFQVDCVRTYDKTLIPLNVFFSDGINWQRVLKMIEVWVALYAESVCVLYVY